jgi:membrane-bound ClpP family serine protease
MILILSSIPVILYTLILFICPCIFFVMHLKNQPNSLIGLVGLIFIIAQSISSLTYQVLDFKLYAIVYNMATKLKPKRNSTPQSQMKGEISLENATTSPMAKAAQVLRRAIQLAD